MIETKDAPAIKDNFYAEFRRVERKVSSPAMSTKQPEESASVTDPAAARNGATTADGRHGEGREALLLLRGEVASKRKSFKSRPSTTEPWVLGTLDTPVGVVPQVDTRLRPTDHLGTWRVRWGIGRMRYRVDPGLYAVGQPTPESPVLVSANYKMSFDRLRSQLAGIDAWVLVLDTRGVNVWCAAGKGTFGTNEIVGRVRANRLGEIVSHRTLVVPQLAHRASLPIRSRIGCGFRVVYGPVRAADLPAFLANGMKATPEMRQVVFPFWTEWPCVPVELVRWAKYIAVAVIVLMFLSGLGPEGYSWQRVLGTGLFSGGLLLATYVASNVLGPALLPWLPGRALSLKGACLGFALVLRLVGVYWLNPGAIEIGQPCSAGHC